MRRRAGVGAIQRQKITQDKFKEKGSEIQEHQIEEMTKQMGIFSEKLEEFARKYKNEIKKNPTFRKQFQDMCASIGVDPLASGKGFWCEMLGVGDFYYELGVQVIELCVATSHRNGGVMPIEEVVQKLNKNRRADNQITDDDVTRAVKKLKVLGSGLEVVSSGNSQFIFSIPGELSMDQTRILQHAKEEQYVTVSSVSDNLNWTEPRTHRALEMLLGTGLAWRDDQNHPPSYWFPAFFHSEE